jgi:hemoglobin-like flavoprotein
MTPQQKSLVRSTFAQVAPISETAAALFYTRLFELDPTLRPLFKSDLQDQGRKLMQTIAVTVSGLDKLDVLVPIVRSLGSRHAGYGVRDEHYETVAAALIWTLETGLGDAFTPEVGEAWATMYWIVAETMKEGAAEALARSA